uniref:VPS9 domain-containing protein n=1 Tax=Anabas testudineus TaxID=64144 RepID=A0A7N6FL28_ANATE
NFLCLLFLSDPATEERDMVAVEEERMLRLAEQCLERAKSFMGKSTAPLDVSISSSSSPAARKATSPKKSGHRRVLSDGGGEPSPFLPPEIFQKLQTVESQDTSKRELTPIEQASRLNQKLKANYEARLARLTPGQAYQKTSLTLSLQRQMMENLIIAKARQDALQRKMEERRLRLQEEANRRFAASGAMTAEDQEQRSLYTNVLEYEQDHDWPKLWKAKIKENPDNVTLVPHLLLSLCLLSFECLNTASSKDLCLASIEEAFFMPLWSALLALFRKVNREREQAFEASMKLYRDASPEDVGVTSKLFPQEPCLQGSYPYESAVQELKLILKDCCPQRKLECIVRTLRQICVCAEEYRCLHESNSTPTTAAIGADDLLPILSFVALRSQCPQLVSECAALEEFIHEGYLIGEEGYCLTSMQSALAYVESLHTGGTHLPAQTLI